MSMFTERQLSTNDLRGITVYAGSHVIGRETKPKRPVVVTFTRGNHHHITRPIPYDKVRGVIDKWLDCGWSLACTAPA